nr:hypothetical protein [Tanacetum cinerariifolium]
MVTLAPQDRWYETLSTFLIEYKFVRGKIDNTLFVYKTQTDMILVQIYVDDIIFGSTSTKSCKEFAKPMTQRYEMSMMGVLTYFLGFQIKQSERDISINQEKYVNDLLKKYDINCSLVKTLMVTPNNLGPHHSGKAVNKTQYRGMIGSLMYLTVSRSDIQFSTCLCTRYQANHKESHLIVVKRIFRKSTSGACQLLGGKLLCWNAKKQQSVAMSSAEAEYVFRTQEQSILISDHFIRDHILKGDIELYFTPTQYQLADIFTKPLDEPTFKRLIVEVDFISKCYLKEAFTRALTQYKEYLSEFWYMKKTLEESKVEVADGSKRVLLEHMMPEYGNEELNINSTQVFSVYNWTLKLNQPEEPSFTTHTKAILVGEMHKEAHQAAGGPTSLGANREEGAHPQLSSGHDASADSIAEVDLGLSV